MFLGDLDRSKLPPEFKKEGEDWFATFNPKAKRVLDVSLVYTLPHNRKRLVVICSVASITGITRLMMCFPRLVMLLVFDFLRMESTWRRDAIRQPRSTTRKLAPKLGSVFSQRMSVDGTPGSDTSLLHSVLFDETTDGYRNWSVCFSPDGKLLATAAGDGVVRVSWRSLLPSPFSRRMLNMAQLLAL